MSIVARAKAVMAAEKTSSHVAVDYQAHIRRKLRIHAHDPRKLGNYRIGQEGFFDFLLGKKKETVVEITHEDNEFCKKASAEIAALRIDLNKRADIEKEVKLRFKHLTDLFTDEMELFCDTLAETSDGWLNYLSSIGSSLVLLDSLFAKGLPDDPKDVVHSLKVVNDSISANVVSFLKPLLIKGDKRVGSMMERTFVDQHACITIVHSRPSGISTVRQAIDATGGMPLSFLSQATLTIEQKESVVKVSPSEIARLLICADKLIESIRDIDRISNDALGRAHASMKNCVLMATKYADEQGEGEQADMQELISILADQTSGAAYLDFGWSLVKAIDETIAVILDAARAYIKN